MAKINKTKLYAKALAEILSAPAFAKDSVSEEKKIINNFVKFLVDSRYENKAKEVLDLAQDLLLQKEGKRKITFETPRTITSSQKKFLEGLVKKGDVVKEKINPELIAGIKIIINDYQQFDGSLQSKLQKIL